MKSNFKMFLKGFFSIFNITGEHLFIKYSSKSPVQLDYEAILSDWEAVGNDLRKSYITTIQTDFNNNVFEKKQLEHLLNQLTDILNEPNKEKQKKKAKAQFRNYARLATRYTTST